MGDFVANNVFTMSTRPLIQILLGLRNGLLTCYKKWVENIQVSKFFIKLKNP